jgi:hypothetical protein
MPGDIEVINGYDELQTCTVETVKFNSTFKAIARMIIRYLPLVKVDEKKYAHGLSGNGKVMYEILCDYRKVQDSKRCFGMIWKPMMIALFTYFYDSHYREPMNYIIYKMFQRQRDFVFPPHHLDPDCWFRDSRKTRDVRGIFMPAEEVINFHEGAIIVRTPIQPRTYWISIKGSNRFFAIDSNRVIPSMGGWVYPLLIDYGDEKVASANMLFGDSV